MTVEEETKVNAAVNTMRKAWEQMFNECIEAKTQLALALDRVAQLEAEKKAE